MDTTNIKPSQLRKYPLEIFVYCLAVAVVFLTYEYIRLSDYVRNDLTDYAIQMKATMMKNDEQVRELINTIKNHN